MNSKVIPDYDKRIILFDNAAVLCTSYQTTRRHIPEDHYVVIMFFRGYIVDLFILKRAYYWKERTKTWYIIVLSLLSPNRRL
jgi:hypothetical protein